MNYLETGLPHTQLYPRKSFFSPPRSIPMSGLSRKYMGLEPVTRREIDSIINRLSKPKKRQVEEDPVKSIRETRTMVAGTGRFVGRKRMSSLQIEKMVARLYNRQSTIVLDPEEDPDASIADQDENIVVVENEEITEQTEKPGERKNSILRKDSVAGLKTNMNVSFQETKVQLDIPNLNLDTKRGDSKAKEITNVPKQISVQTVKNTKISAEPRSVKPDNIYVQRLDLTKIDNFTNKRSAMYRSSSHENFRPAKVTSVRPSTSDPNRSPKHMRRELTRPATSDSPRSPRQRQTLARIPDDVNKKPENRAPRVSTSMPCDDLLIDRVATYNRSPRGRQDLKR